MNVWRWLTSWPDGAYESRLRMLTLRLFPAAPPRGVDEVCSRFTWSMTPVFVEAFNRVNANMEDLARAFTQAGFITQDGGGSGQHVYFGPLRGRR